MILNISLVQFSSVAQSFPTLCYPMDHSTPGLPVHHQLPEFTQTRVHGVSDAIQPSHPLSSSSPPAPNPSQHQSLFQWVNSSHEVAKVLEFQLHSHIHGQLIFFTKLQKQFNGERTLLLSADLEQLAIHNNWQKPSHYLVSYIIH